MTNRILSWDGGFNIRDLGGLPTISGGTTVPGAIVRAGHPSGLTGTGWTAASAHGVRTVIDLTDPAKPWTDAHPRPAGITTVPVPLDDEEDREFWGPLIASGHWGTALYYRAFLDRFPARTAAVFSAIAAAGPGAVLFHCARGRDRTGLISVLLLALAGVDAVTIADDYDLSNAPQTRREVVAAGHGDDGDAVAEITAKAGTTNHATVRALLDGFDVATYLSDAGVSDTALSSIRQRLIGNVPTAMM